MIARRLAPLALLAWALGCTPFTGRARDAAVDASDTSDAETLALGRTYSIASREARAPRIDAIRWARSGAQSLLVVHDRVSQSLYAHRLRDGGQELDAREVLGVSDGAVDAADFLVAPRPGGWLVYGGEGVVWVDANGAVSRRSALRANGALFANGTRGRGVALGWTGERAGLLLSACVEGQCVVARRDLLPDGRASTPTTLYHVETKEFSVAAALDESGGQLAVTEAHDGARVARRIGLNAAGALSGDDERIDALPAGSRVRSVVTTPAGERAWLIASDTEARVVSVGGGPARVGPALASSVTASLPTLLAVAGGFALAASDDGLRVRSLDARGAQTAEQVVSSVPAEQFAVALERTSAGAAMAAWAVVDAAGVEVIAVPGPASGARGAWSVQPLPERITQFDLLRGAGPVVLEGPRMIRLDPQGAVLSSRAMAGLASPRGAALVVGDEVWTFDAPRGLATLHRLDATGNELGAVMLDATSRDAPVFRAVATAQGAVVAIDDGFVRLGLDGYAQGGRRVAHAGATAERLIAASDGAFLWVEASDSGLWVRAFDAAGNAIHAEGIVLDGVSAAGSVDGWSCGPACWIVATSAGLWRVTSEGALPQPTVLPEGAIGVRCAVSDAFALVAMRRVTGETLAAVTRVDGAGALEAITPLGLRADDGMAALGLSGGRFLLVVSGVDPSAPTQPGLFAVQVQRR